MSEAMAIIGGLVLFGIIRVRPVFGLSSDEAGLILGMVLMLMAFVAWCVEAIVGAMEDSKQYPPRDGDG